MRKTGKILVVVCAAVALLVSFGLREASADASFIRGDYNADGKMDISDPVAILGYLFANNAPTPCLDTADVNDDGKVDISDPIAALGFLFNNGTPPPAPFGECGVDETEDAIDCQRYNIAVCPNETPVEVDYATIEQPRVAAGHSLGEESEEIFMPIEVLLDRNERDLTWLAVADTDDIMASESGEGAYMSKRIDGSVYPLSEEDIANPILVPLNGEEIWYGLSSRDNVVDPEDVQPNEVWPEYPQDVKVYQRKEVAAYIDLEELSLSTPIANGTAIPIRIDPRYGQEKIYVGVWLGSEEVGPSSSGSLYEYEIVPEAGQPLEEYYPDTVVIGPVGDLPGIPEFGVQLQIWVETKFEGMRYNEPNSVKFFNKYEYTANYSSEIKAPSIVDPAEGSVLKERSVDFEIDRGHGWPKVEIGLAVDPASFDSSPWGDILYLNENEVEELTAEGENVVRFTVDSAKYLNAVMEERPIHLRVWYKPPEIIADEFEEDWLEANYVFQTDNSVLIGDVNTLASPAQCDELEAIAPHLLGQTPCLDDDAVQFSFKRGDANYDGTVNIADAMWILGYLFQGGEAPSCLKAADINDDGKVNISDPVALLDYLFVSGPEPAEPFNQCGIDPTEDDLTCDWVPYCDPIGPVGPKPPMIISEPSELTSYDINFQVVPNDAKVIKLGLGSEKYWVDYSMHKKEGGKFWFQPNPEDRATYKPWLTPSQPSGADVPGKLVIEVPDEAPGFIPASFQLNDLREFDGGSLWVGIWAQFEETGDEDIFIGIHEIKTKNIGATITTPTNGSVLPTSIDIINKSAGAGLSSLELFDRETPLFFGVSYDIDKAYSVGGDALTLGPRFIKNDNGQIKLSSIILEENDTRAGPLAIPDFGQVVHMWMWTDADGDGGHSGKDVRDIINKNMYRAPVGSRTEIAKINKVNGTSLGTNARVRESGDIKIEWNTDPDNHQKYWLWISPWSLDVPENIFKGTVGRTPDSHLMNEAIEVDTNNAIVKIPEELYGKRIFVLLYTKIDDVWYSDEQVSLKLEAPNGGAEAVSSGDCATLQQYYPSLLPLVPACQ